MRPRCNVKRELRIYTSRAQYVDLFIFARLMYLLDWRQDGIIYICIFCHAWVPKLYVRRRLSTYPFWAREDAATSACRAPELQRNIYCMNKVFYFVSPTNNPTMDWVSLKQKIPFFMFPSRSHNLPAFDKPVPLVKY